MSVKFIPHRCATVHISIKGELIEVTARGYETEDAAEISEIKNSPVYGTWLMEDLPQPEEEPVQMQVDDYYIGLQPVPSVGSVDIAEEEAALAEQVAIREEQAKEEIIKEQIGLAVDEGIKSEMRKRTPGGKDPAGGKSKKKDIPKEESGKKRGRPPKAK